ncbi:putative pentatricopeptide repeat-containing protein At3g49142 [Punica granatum]|uniref:Pentatricopeptide repeat-containing protein At3g49142 n=2 Tax=Punica granatum TaxID=22663 RepID=A0A6P8CL21_PUNGR|nr:putative pentatricopeptide repeat-containing protein At3g49142 [Punica granatum]
MKTITSFSRHFSSLKQLQLPLRSIPESHFSTCLRCSALTEELCSKLLDQCPDLNTLKKLHFRIITNPTLSLNPSLAIKLMRAYAARGHPGSARHVFDQVPQRNVVFYNVMIRGYTNNHLYGDAMLVYKMMSCDGIRCDNYTYPCVLKACSGSINLAVGVQTHAEVVKVGLVSNLFVGNGLVAMYGKCGCLIDAHRALDEIPRRDVVSWNSMVAGYAQNGFFDDALSVCREMELSNLKADAGTMASLLPAVTDTSPNNVSFVEEMFNRLTIKSLVSWNVMIAVYTNNSMPEKAVDLFLKMEAQGLEPDAITLASVLPACGDLSALSLGRRIHEFVKNKRLCPNLSLENALIDMYAKCGCLSDAREVFDQLKFRDIVSWTSMISAHGISGLGHDAVALFSKMRDSGLSPDSIAFVSVLSACSHSGLLDEGRNYFKSMVEEYGIEPRLEHFACMVDLLGRAGRVDEAYGFIKKMPVEPNERVWGALLSACRVHSNTDIGVKAADNLFQLVPEQSGYYVLLSNIYAKAGRWREVTNIRSLMKRKGIKKTPGISNVELGNKVHTFLAGDQFHSESKRIYQELDVLMGKMRELGYTPETDSTLHDVEDEDKEGHLAVHSEKLAVVFAILNTETRTAIRVTKNLRICGDCHVAIKLISKITQRGITVRDTNRFHHFANGDCSCGDYW